MSKNAFSTGFKGGAVHFALLLIRLTAIMMLINHGLPKIQNFDTLAGAFYDPLGMGFKFMLILTIFAEVVCAGFVVIGLLTRWAALVLFIEMLITTFGYHAGDAFADIELDLHYILIFAVLILLGAGKYSVDHFLAKKNKPVHV